MMNNNIPLWEKDFKGTPIVFKDNVRDKKDFKPQNQIVFEAEKMRMELPKIIFPTVTFTDVQVKFIEHDGAAVCWTTPECDGLGSIAYREKGETKDKRLWTPRQGVRHELGVTGLKPDTEYEFRLIFSGRRGGPWKRSGTCRKSTGWPPVITCPIGAPAETMSIFRMTNGSCSTSRTSMTVPTDSLN